jgi:hypothetical protein
MVFTVLVLGLCTVGFAFWLHYSHGLGDHKVQTFLSYSLSFTINFLSLLTIFLSIGTITRDIKRREILTIATKPISRGQFLVGKFMGMALLNLILLTAAGSVIYGATRILTHTETKGDQATQKEARRRLEELILIAREKVLPTIPGISEQEIDELAKREADKLVEQEKRYLTLTDPREIEAMRNSVINDLTNQISLRLRSVPPGRQVNWKFTGINPIDRENGSVYLRYKLDVTPDPPKLNIAGLWFYGDHPDVIHTTQPHITDEVIRTVHEFPIPVNRVSDDGELYLTFVNPLGNYPVTIIFPTPSEIQPSWLEKVSLEALYVVGGFDANFLRAMTALYLRLLFLGIVGLALGAWLSFPVAILVLTAVFIIGIASNFIIEAMQWQTGISKTSFGQIMMVLFPRFAAYDPVPKIEMGKLVSYQMLGQCLGIMILIKGGMAALGGYIIFKLRELARVIV